eukprot:scaffold99599_cov57-Phaeocystis_antarctica.AAC.1
METPHIARARTGGSVKVNGGRLCHGGRDLAREQQLCPVLLAHVDQLESDIIHLFVELLQCCRVHAQRLEEGLLEHRLDRPVGQLKVLQSLLSVGLEQLPQEGGCRREVDARATLLSLVEGLVERPTQRRVWRGRERAQVFGCDVIVDVGEPERPPEAEVEEHDAE